MNIVDASGSFMDCSIDGLQVESQCGQSCNKHCVCRSQLHKGIFVCFRKTWFAWRGGEEEDVLEVFHLDSGSMGCNVGYLPKHLAAQADCYIACVSALWRFTPAIAHVVIALQNDRNTILALGVAWPGLRECVTCLQLHRPVKNNAI